MRTRLVLLITAILVALPAAANAVTPVRVLDTPDADEQSSAMQGDFFGWTSNSAQRPGAFKAFVSEAGGEPQRIKIEGDVSMGDVIVDGPLAGQVVVTAHELRGGDIRFYDLAADAEAAAPQGVNTNRLETGGTVSGDYLAFSRRINRYQTDVILYRFSTDTFTTVASGWFFVTQLNGDYLTYMKCTQRTCDVWRYQISTGDRDRMPRAARGRANYWPGVGADGTVYYVQGDNDDCGRNTRILRWVDGTVTRALKVADGTELGSLHVGTDGTDPVLSFTEIACRRGDTGIYRIPIA